MEKRLGSLALLILVIFTFLTVTILMVMDEGIITALPEPVAPYIMLHIPYIVSFLVLTAGARILLSVSFRNLVSPCSGRIRRECIIIPAIIYLTGAIALDLISYRNISPTGIGAGHFLLELCAAMICAPVQCLTEEMVFRALPMRIIHGGRWPSSPVKALPYVIITGLLFMLAHGGNAETGTAAGPALLYYFSWGALAALLAAATGGFEAGTAMHIVNNLHVTLLVNYTSSSMASEALFINNSLPLGISSFIILFILFGLTYLVLDRTGYILEGFRIHG